MPTATSAKTRRQTRTALDPRLARARLAASDFEPPRHGWIRAIRTALNMSASDLAVRLKLTPSTVTRMELGETEGTIQLSTLKKAAEALNCDLVYALIPRESLANSVRSQASKKASKTLGPIAHTMNLENQSVPDYLSEHVREELIAKWMTKPGLWSD